MKRNFFSLVASQSVTEEGRLSMLRIINLLEDIKPVTTEASSLIRFPTHEKAYVKAWHRPFDGSSKMMWLAWRGERNP
jgi:hypothetical protein